MSANELRESVCSQVARILRDERKSQRLSMTRLAEQAGLSQSMISLIEHDLRNPTLDTLLRITAVLEIELPEVLIKAKAAALKANRRG